MLDSINLFSLKNILFCASILYIVIFSLKIIGERFKKSKHKKIKIIPMHSFGCDMFIEGKKCKRISIIRVVETHNNTNNIIDMCPKCFLEYIKDKTLIIEK